MPKRITVIITTIVVAWTSFRLGNVTFRISLRTSVRNPFTRVGNCVTLFPPSSSRAIDTAFAIGSCFLYSVAALQTADQACPPIVCTAPVSLRLSTPAGLAASLHAGYRLFQNLAGAEGFEPPSPVLETGSLAVELTPLLFKGSAIHFTSFSVLRPHAALALYGARFAFHPARTA